MIVKKRIIKVSSDLYVKKRRDPISQPWYIGYEIKLPMLDASGWAPDASPENPMTLIRNFGYHIYCYETLDDCIKVNNEYLISARIQCPNDKFDLEVPHDMYEKAVNGEINGMSYAIGKLIEYIDGQFEAPGTSVLQTYDIDSETGTYSLVV